MKKVFKPSIIKWANNNGFCINIISFTCKPTPITRAIGISKGLPVSAHYVQRVIDEYPHFTDQEICDLIIRRYETNSL